LNARNNHTLTKFVSISASLKPAYFSADLACVLVKEITRNFAFCLEQF